MIMDQKVEYYKLPFYRRLTSIFMDLMITFSLFIVFLLLSSIIVPNIMNNDEKLNDYTNRLTNITYASNLYEIEDKAMVEIYEDDNITNGFDYTGHLDEYLENKEESGLFIYEDGIYKETGDQKELEKFYKENWTIALNYVKETDEYKKYEELFNDKYQSYLGVLFGIPALIATLTLILIPFFNKEGKTISKFIFKISVVNDNLAPLNRLQIFIRQFFFVLFTITIIPSIVSFIISLFNKEGKTLHDYISMSRVIDSKVKNMLLNDKNKKDQEIIEKDKLVFKGK